MSEPPLTAVTDGDFKEHVAPTLEELRKVSSPRWAFEEVEVNRGKREFRFRAERPRGLEWTFVKQVSVDVNHSMCPERISREQTGRTVNYRCTVEFSDKRVATGGGQNVEEGFKDATEELLRWTESVRAAALGG